MGVGWMDQFFANCTTCTLDFVAIHWYSNDDPEGFKSHVQQLFEYKRPIWTEFAASGSVQDQISFLQAVLQWLDSQAQVERYAYLWTFPGFLVNENGNAPSQPGQVYATYSW